MKLATTDTAQYANDGSAERGEFARQLSALHRAAGAPSLRHVATLAQQRVRNTEGDRRLILATAQRISDWMNGRHVPARFESLVPVLHVLGVRARRQAGTPPKTLSLRAWRSLWTAARRAPATASHTTTQPLYSNADEFSKGQEPAFFGWQPAIGSAPEMVRTLASSKRSIDAIVFTDASGIGNTAALHGGIAAALSTQSTRWGLSSPRDVSIPFGRWREYSVPQIISAHRDLVSSSSGDESVTSAAADRRPIRPQHRSHRHRKAEFLTDLPHNRSTGNSLASTTPPGSSQ